MKIKNKLSQDKLELNMISKIIMDRIPKNILERNLNLKERTTEMYSNRQCTTYFINNKWHKRHDKKEINKIIKTYAYYRELYNDAVESNNVKQ